MAEEKLSTAVRRAQIARAALAVVAERGLGGLSVAAIAQRVGLVPSALYRHFAGKGAILDAIVDLARGTLLGNLARVRAHRGGTLPRLRRLLRLHAAFIEEVPALPRVLFAEDFDRGGPERRRRVAAAVRDYLAGIEELVRRGQRAGEVRRGVDAAAAAGLVLGLVQSAALQWHLREGRVDVARQVERWWRLVRAALAA